MKKQRRQPVGSRSLKRYQSVQAAAAATLISLLAGCGNYTPTAGVTPATDYRETLRECSREMHAAYGYDWLYGFGLVGATVAMASNSQPGGRDDYYRECMARHGYTSQD